MKFKKSYPPATWTDLKTPAPVIKPPVTVKWIHGCIKVSQWRRSWSCQAQEENCFATTLELELELPRLGQAGGSAPTQARDHSPLRSRAAGNIWSCLGAVFVPRFVPVSVCNVFLFPWCPTDQDVKPWDSIVNQAAASPNLDRRGWTGANLPHPGPSDKIWSRLYLSLQFGDFPSPQH